MSVFVKHPFTLGHLLMMMFLRILFCIQT